METLNFIIQKYFLLKLHLGQPFHNLHRLHTDVYYAQQQVQNITRIAAPLCPVVKIVSDAAFFMCCYLIPFHNPFNRTLMPLVVLAALTTGSLKFSSISGRDQQLTHAKHTHLHCVHPGKIVTLNNVEQALAKNSSRIKVLVVGHVRHAR